MSAARNGSSGTKYKFDSTGRELGDAIRLMLRHTAANDLAESYKEFLDEIEMKWEGAAADNPFHRRVDIFIDFSDGWEAALDYLRENFGVTMERVSEPTTYEVLVLSPRNEGD